MIYFDVIQSSSSMITQCSIYYCDANHFASCGLQLDYTHANYNITSEVD